MHRRLPGTLVRGGAGGGRRWRWPPATGTSPWLGGIGKFLAFDPAMSAPDLPLVDKPDPVVARVLGRLQEIDPELFSRIATASQVRGDVVLDLGGRRLWLRPDVTAEVIRAVIAAEQDSAGKAARGRNSTAGSPARWWCGGGLGERLSPAAGRRARPRHHPGRGHRRRGDRRFPRSRWRASSASASSGPRGMRRGVVRDIEDTTRAITKAMTDAERMAGVEVGTVYCGIAGEHVAGRSSHGMVSVTGDEIRTGDVARVNDMASNVSFGRDHELLHAIPQDYIIDQQPGISEPIGMTRLPARGRGVPGHRAVERDAEPAARVERAGYSGRRVRAGAAGGVAGGADPRRTGARLRHRGAGRRLDQRVYLPGRQDPPHRLAALRRRACHRRHGARPPGDPAGRRADQGAVRGGLRAAGAGRRRHRAARARRARGPGARTGGCSRI